MALLVKRQDELLVELKASTEEGFPRAKEEWERTVTAWGNDFFFQVFFSASLILSVHREEDGEA